MIQHTWIGPNGTELNLTASFAAFRLMSGAVEGLGDPQTDDFTQERALIDGQLFTGYRAKARECYWPFLLNGRGGWESLQSMLWSSLGLGEYGTWRVTAPSGGVRELACRYVPGDYTPERDPSVFTAEVFGINLIADYDPWWRGPLVQKEFQTGETPEPFYAPSGSTAVLNLMSANTVDTATLSNPGEIPAWTMLTFRGPITAFDVRWDDPDGLGVAGPVEVPDGWSLVIDTDPTSQAVDLVDPDGNTSNVFGQLTEVDFEPIQPGSDLPIFITLNGAGSLLVEFRPGYRRAY